MIRSKDWKKLNDQPKQKKIVQQKEFGVRQRANGKDLRKQVFEEVVKCNKW